MFKDIVNKELILERVSEEDIFKYYFKEKYDCDIKIEEGESIISPIRKDENPDCQFYYDKRGRLKFHDWARDINWDCFNLVQYIYNVGFQDSLNIIAKDFDVVNRKKNNKIIQSRQSKIIDNKFSRIIQVKIRDWDYRDKEYWEKYHLNSNVLRFYNVYPISQAWMGSDENNIKLIYDNNYYDIGYCYYFGDENYKLYFPTRLKGGYPKFYHNNSSIIQGLSQLEPMGDFLVITKSLKDVMCMSMFGINAISPMSESIFLRKLIIDNLRERFTEIYTLFDRDIRGIQSTRKMRDEFNTKPLLFKSEDEKDFSDNLKEHGYQYMLDYINYAKEKV